jgi:type 1 glutamine amidotransferase
MQDLAQLTPEHTAWCRDWITRTGMVPGGLYHPVKLRQPTISFPGLQGGTNWGGGAFDPRSGLLYVNTSDLGQVTELVESAGPLPFERGPISGRFMQAETRMPCQKPPWGQLHAIDMVTGKIAWQATLGRTAALPRQLPETGRPNVGGPIVTAGGLVFIGATDDNQFRAFDATSGRLLWSQSLQASAHATPMTYRGSDGRQFVVNTATGGSYLDSPVASDTIVAYALPAATARRPPDPYADRKRLLVIADLSTGNQIAHLGVSHAIATIERLGRESGAYVAILRTDTDLVTKGEVWGAGDYAKGGPKQARMHSLDYFDAVLFYTNGELRLSTSQKRDLLDFIATDGKGFIGVHTAAITAAGWPEYREMLGGFFDNHPWNVSSARIIVEQPDSPMMKGFTSGEAVVDEHYQFLSQPFDRGKVDVLARLDPASLDLADPDVHRKDRDFPVAWIKSFGKGRVFYSYLGHTDAAWDDPRIQQMYVEGIRWAINGGQPPRPHPVPPH